MPAISITFSQSFTTITLSPPGFEYKTTIDFPFSQTRKSDGKITAFDPGQTYDVRSCSCEFMLTAEEQAGLVDFLENESYARQADEVEMYIDNTSGFFPFGPDVGNNGTFFVAISKPRFVGIGSRPYKFFRTSMELTNTGPYPSYSIPSEIRDGSWTFGTVSQCRFPVGWYRPDPNIMYDMSIGRNATADFVDRGTTADSYTTKFKMVSNPTKTAKIVEYLTGTARSDPFTITTPNGVYPFGYSKGTGGSFYARLAQKRIEIKHTSFQTFEFDLSITLE